MANRFFVIIIYACCSFLMISHGLRIKRSENFTTDVMANSQKTVNGSITTSTVTTELPKGVCTDAANQTESIGNGTTTAKTTEKEEGLVTSTTTASLPPANGSSHVGKVELILDEGLPLEVARLHHGGKRHLGRIDEVLMPSHQARHRRHHSGSLDAGQGSAVSSPPYVYYNKMISPDGKQEVKEFEILAPNMMIESVQQELNYGPDQDLGGLLLLNAAETKNGHMDIPSKRHRKHKSSSPVVPPMLYMLQHLMQSASNLDNPIVDPSRQSHRNAIDGPLYQFLDNAVDLALRNNHEVVEHLLGDHLDNDIEMEKDKDREKDKVKGKDKDKESEMEKEKKELHNDKSSKGIIEHKDDELILSCPIHHEHHANKNGELVDDDVVLVNECHFV